MTNEKYNRILREGTRVDWYDEQVPEDLINTKVITWSNLLVSEIRILEGELSDLKGVASDKRKHYIKSLWKNVKNSPYSLNGDVYLKKKKSFDDEMAEIEAKKVKTVKKPRKKTTKRKTTTSVTNNKVTTPKKGGTKNSSIIFGKK